MTTNKPEVVAWSNELHLSRLKMEVPHTGSGFKAKGQEEVYFHTALIRLSDYESLQAECAKLRKDAERYRWLRDKSESLHSFYLSTPVWMTGVRFHPENVDSTIDAAIQEYNPC